MTNKTILTMLLGMLLTVSCRKFEDGGTKINARSKLTNETWQYIESENDSLRTEIYKDGKQVVINNRTLELNKDGNFKYTIEYNDRTAVNEGMWDLLNEKNSILFVSTSNPYYIDSSKIDEQTEEFEWWFITEKDTFYRTVTSFKGMLPTPLSGSIIKLDKEELIIESPGMWTLTVADDSLQSVFKSIQQKYIAN